MVGYAGVDFRYVVVGAGKGLDGGEHVLGLQSGLDPLPSMGWRWFWVIDAKGWRDVVLRVWTLSGGLHASVQGFDEALQYFQYAVLQDVEELLPVFECVFQQFTHGLKCRLVELCSTLEGGAACERAAGVLRGGRFVKQAAIALRKKILKISSSGCVETRECSAMLMGGPEMRMMALGLMAVPGHFRRRAALCPELRIGDFLHLSHGVDGVLLDLSELGFGGG